MSKSIYSIIVLPKTKYQKTFSSGLGKNIKIINNNYFTYNFNKIYHVKKKNTNYNIIKKKLALQMLCNPNSIYL